MRFRFLFLIAVLGLFPAWVHAQREKLPWEDLEIVEKRYPNAKRTSTGLRTVLVKEGKGDHPVPGDLVDVSYEGRLLNGTLFDRADPSKPFSFRIGRGNVIDGWEEGLQLMRPGERRIFIIPFELGYGTRGDPPKIPQRATLVFDVELLGVHHDESGK